MKILIIYTHEGYTYKFKNVNNISIVNKEIHFSYIGIRSGKKSVAVFNNISGYTLMEEK